MEGFCRACLIKYDEPMEILQYTEKNRRLYVYCTGLQVKRTDVFTFQLCKDCYVNMKLACKFKKQCRTSDKRFKHYLSLKEFGEATDFETYLKNNDDSLLLKFPMLNGNITPSVQKARDDDNASSTNTSIRNFMRDLLRPDEIPDTEARIIREVIEEEADVLDDSLDSHWLQDDISIDTDFRFSFSPFSTPRSGKNEPVINTTPSKETSSEDETVEIDKERFLAAKKILLKSTIQNSVDATVKHNKQIPIYSKPSFNFKPIKTPVIPTEDNTTPVITAKAIPIKEINIPNNEQKTDTIDIKLEQALQSEDVEQFCLDDILATPPIYPGVSAPSTPTITNILFGDKLEIPNENSNPQKAGRCIENYQNVEGSEVDILEDFFNKETGEYIGEHKEVPEVFSEIGNESVKDFQVMDRNEEVRIEQKSIFDKPGKSRYDLSDMSCKLCDKKYNTVKALKIHFAKLHKFKIVGQRTKEMLREVTCDYCGEFFKRLSNLRQHITRKHLKRPSKIVSKCSQCSLEFSSKPALRMHMTTHIGKRALLPPEKKFVCSICAYVTSSASNLRVHMFRHAKKYLFDCSECGKGFCRKTDYLTHIRTHNGERPYKCSYCERSFARSDVLNRHTKLHTDERPYKCDLCNATFITNGTLKNHMQKYRKKCNEMRLKNTVIQAQGLNQDKDTKYYVVIEDTVPVISNIEIENVDLRDEESSENNQEHAEKNMFDIVNELPDLMEMENGHSKGLVADSNTENETNSLSDLLKLI